MRCPGCNKFPAFDTSTEPEVNDLEVEVNFPESEDDDNKEKDLDHADVSITGNVRIVLTSECCGEECKEATFEIDLQLEIDRAADCTCDLADLEADADPGEITDRMETINAKGKRINPRYARRFYGVEVPIDVSCQCGKTKEEVLFKEEIQASGMDELG